MIRQVENFQRWGILATKSSSNNMLETVKDAISNQKSTEKNKEKDYSNCSHNFGYLAKLSKNAPIPEECFLCPKVVECIVPL